MSRNILSLRDACLEAEGRHCECNRAAAAGLCEKLAMSAAGSSLTVSVYLAEYLLFHIGYRMVTDIMWRR